MLLWVRGLGRLRTLHKGRMSVWFARAVCAWERGRWENLCQSRHQRQAARRSSTCWNSRDPEDMPGLCVTALHQRAHSRAKPAGGSSWHRRCWPSCHGPHTHCPGARPPCQSSSHATCVSLVASCPVRVAAITRGSCWVAWQRGTGGDNQSRPALWRIQPLPCGRRKGGIKEVPAPSFPPKARMLAPHHGKRAKRERNLSTGSEKANL